jgi:miniconductance mechanosensitive channel
MKKINHFIYNELIALGLTENTSKFLNMLVLLIALLATVFILDYVLRRLIRVVYNTLAVKTKSDFDDILIQNKVPRNIAHIIPLVVYMELMPNVFLDYPQLELIMFKGVKVLGIAIVLWLVRSILNTIKVYLKTFSQFKDKPIDSYIQVFMIFAWAFGFTFAFAIVTDIHLISFFSALGAISAVIILVFKDTILGFVASIQVAINDMVRIGDWITFEKYGADGDVTEINLATVKVQNFDNTITTIPTYALISDSFKNWRGMMDSDGRRIKRAINIKQNSIKFLSETDVDKLKNIQLLTAYLETRQEKISKYNEEQAIDKSLLINGKNLTNIGVFRKYIESYVENHSAINSDMSIMVRQLAPTTQGIPLEIYAFSNDKVWKNYEYIIADIFDHVLATIPYFDLELFELPNNSNFN